MTDRAEIERLLNQTGRTLEGLPTQDDYWYSDDYVDRNEEIGMMMYRSGFKRNEPYILYQSDVIELLVGALRDALDKPMQKPLTLEELKTETTDSYVWEERRTDLNIYFERTSALVLAFMCVNSKEDMYKYGSSVRAWKKMPTDEEREAAAWES